MQRLHTLVVVLLGAIVVAFGWSLAQAQRDDTTIQGCVERNGVLRIISADATCRTSETPLRWNTQGPAGPPGASSLSQAHTEVVGRLHLVSAKQGTLPPVAVQGYAWSIARPGNAPIGHVISSGFQLTVPLTRTAVQLTESLNSNEIIVSATLELLPEAGEQTTVSYRLNNARVVAMQTELQGITGEPLVAIVTLKYQSLLQRVRLPDGTVIEAVVDGE